MDENAQTQAFVDRLSARDFDGLAASLAPDAVAHLLLPRGPQQTTGREAIARRFEGWFGAAEPFTVLATTNDTVGARRLISWRFRLSRDGKTTEVIEQVAFANAGPNGIERLDLLCSGFLAEGQAGVRSV